MTCVESSKRSYFLHLLVITLRTKTRQFISPVQRAIRNALVSPETSYGSSEAALGDFVPASLEGAYARQMLVEDSSGYCGIAPVWRWPSFTAAENIRLWRCLYQISATTSQCSLLANRARKPFRFSAIQTGNQWKWPASHHLRPVNLSPGWQTTLPDPGYSRLLPDQRAPSQALLAPKLGLASVGRRGQRRGIQRGLGRCSCIMLQICPCWPLIAHHPFLGMFKYCMALRQHAGRLVFML